MKEKVETEEDKRAKLEKRRANNRSVYVSGLPPDATIAEMKEMFEKYGILMEDVDTGM